MLFAVILTAGMSNNLNTLILKAGRVDPFTFSMQEVGPYEKYQSDPTVTFEEKTTNKTMTNVKEIFRFGNGTNPNLRTVTKSEHHLILRSTYTGTITLPTSLFMGDSGFQVTVEILNTSTSETINTFNFTIYPKNHTEINPVNTKSIALPHTKVNISSNKLSYITEKYSFEGITDYFLTDTYYRLPIEQFYIEKVDFTYSPLPIGNSYLIIEGLREYFPTLSYADNKVKIPLTAVEQDQRVYWKLKGPLYVEPKLLLMSNTPREGFVSTTKFYLPVNHARDLLGSTFSFEINNLGLNDITLKWSSALLTSGGLIGNCQNSGYCVTGKVRK